MNELMLETQDIDNGLVSRIYRIDSGYSVSLYDVDANENVGIFKIFQDLETAKEYSRSITNGQ